MTVASVAPVRAADKDIYLVESRYENPKEYYKVCKDLIDKSGVVTGDKPCHIVDVGCAAGEMLYYFRKVYGANGTGSGNVSFSGIDVVPELLEKARKTLPDVRIENGSILSPDALSGNSADIITCSGVMQIFDDYKLCLSNPLHWCKPGGFVYVVGIVNPHPIDVWIQHKSSEAPEDAPKEVGWNLFSEASLRKHLEATGCCESIQFHDFQMPFDLHPQEDPMRTWTTTVNNARVLTCGLNLLCTMKILQIQKKSS